MSHYRLKLGQTVEQRFAGHSLRGVVVGLAIGDNNRAYIRLDDGTKADVVAEWCVVRGGRRGGQSPDGPVR